jgi:hypothetical protein
VRTKCRTQSDTLAFPTSSDPYFDASSSRNQRDVMKSTPSDTKRLADKSVDQTETRIKLPNALAKRFQFAAQQPDFINTLTKFLESEVVEVDNYPQLKLLCWNRRNGYLTAEDAWSLYERNWRFVEPEQLEIAERQLIETLTSRYGEVARG